MDLKKLLNKEQYDAAVNVDGPILILAGAGSGKTRVLTHRIAHLIKDLNVYPSQVLAITFTNKAAGEMKERVRLLVGDEAENMWVSTFHSSCVRILRREIEKLGFSKNFAIYDSYDQKTLLKQCMSELNIDEKSITDKEIGGKIGELKDNLISPEDFKIQSSNNYKLNKIADVYVLYQKKLKNSNALDFDDLIFKTVELFNKNKDILEFYQRKFKYIMVDEYQDTNKAQYQLVRLLAAAHRNICVVGDDDQCIYEWRGADIRNILDFEKDYPEAKVIKLEENYRSKRNILDAANSVIKNNSERKNKVLRTSSDKGEKIKVYRAFSDLEEADFAAGEIKRLIREEDKSLKEFAVLYRTNAQSRIFEESFRRADLPYRIIGGLKFYDRKEIKDIMAYLKLLNNPLDDISLKRIINVPKRSIGDATVSKVQGFANTTEECLYSTMLDVENVPGLTSRNITSINKFISLMNSFMEIKKTTTISKLIETILEETGYLAELKSSKDVEDESRLENLKELVSDAVEFEKSSEDASLEAYLEKVTLVSDIDNFDEAAETIVMMTLHSAKGLEFPVVFMVGMENGIFPGAASLSNPAEMEESRRLCYVGITRAKEKLYMTSAERRVVFGRTVAYEQSDFVGEISQDLKDYIGKPQRNVNINGTNKPDGYNNPHTLRNLQFKSSMPSMTQKSSGEQLNEAEAVPGRKVRHSKFGVGTIISVSKDGSDTKLTIAFDNMGIKNLILNVAPLELM